MEPVLLTVEPSLMSSSEHALLETVYTHDAVADGNNRADVAELDLSVVILDAGLYKTRYFIGA